MRNLKKKGEINPWGRNEERNKGKESSPRPVIMGLWEEQKQVQKERQKKML